MDCRNGRNTFCISELVCSIVKKIIENLIVLIASLVGMFLLATVFLPNFGYKLIVIKSGSMAPTIKTGSAVIIHKNDNYQNKDIITFIKKANASKELVTHRIIKVDSENGKQIYKTKGDNNNVEDQETTLQKNVLGKVILKIPYFGWLIAFLKSKVGMVILILVPAGYFIFREIVKIKNELKKKRINANNESTD